MNDLTTGVVIALLIILIFWTVVTYGCDIPILKNFQWACNKMGFENQYLNREFKKAKEGLSPIGKFPASYLNQSMQVAALTENIDPAIAKSLGLAKPKSKETYDNMANKALMENTEYFATCKDGGATQKVLDCVCDNNDPNNFATWEFGAPNMSYQDYVASQGVDSKVIENHLMFVRDRRGLGPEGEFITGRTYSPDSHDSYNYMPWVGIRPKGGASYIEMCNPTQVPDVDTNLFKGNRPYCFWT